MKKITQIALTIIFVFAMNIVNAAVLNIQGQVSPVNGPINIIMTYDDAGMTYTATMMTDISGNFLYTDSTISSSQGSVIVTFNNCSGNAVSDTTFYSPSPAGGLFADFGVINYCTNINGILTSMGTITNSPANFSINVSYDNGITYTVVGLNASGAFSDAVPVPAGLNYVHMNFIDCNGVLQSDSAQVVAAFVGFVADFGNINYCNSPLNLSTVNGSFSNVNGNFTYSISLDGGLTFQTYTYTPNATGAFSQTYNVYSTNGVAIIQYIDCNGITQTDSTTNISGSPNQEIFDFGNLNYCNTSTSGSIVSGSFTNVTGNLTYSISLDNGLTFQTFTFTANPTGGFSQSFNTLSTSGVAIIQYIDCNGVTQTDSTTNISGSPSQEIFDFATMDFCPNINPPACSAGFVVSQNLVATPNGTIVSSGNVMIVNSSTGQNLSYTWDFGDNSPTYTGLNFTHTYPSVGPWTLCLTVDDGNNCVSTFCDSLMVDTNGVLTGKTNGGFTIQMGNGEDDTNGPNSIKELADQIDVTLFPNPANHEVSLQLNSKISDQATISIYNALGSLVDYQSTEITTGNQTIKINIDNLNSGLFIIQLKTNEGTISKKLIKK